MRYWYEGFLGFRYLRASPRRGFVSFIAGIWALYLKYFDNTTFVQTPLPLLFTLGFITGVMCVLMGLLAEVLVRIYFEARDKRPYTVKERINFDPPA